MAVIRHKEAIHSGQFMVSEFEADEEDIEDIPAVVGDLSNANKDEGISKLSKSASSSEFIPPQNITNRSDQNFKGGGSTNFLHKDNLLPDESIDRNERGKSVDSGRECPEYNSPRYFPIEAIRKRNERYPLLPVPNVEEHIEQSDRADGANQVTTTKIYINQQGGVIQRAIQSRRSSGFENLPLRELFQSMSVAYRHKLTSPKWNRFKGLKLRWKDKIRLNNVIWRCWHLQYKENRKKLLCGFANPLELENHKHTEAGPVVQGKYWKRKLDTIKIEYMRWRTWYHSDCNFNENESENDSNATLTKDENPTKELVVSNTGNERNRKISRISENDKRVGSSATTDKLDLDKAMSKDDWNLEQLLFDENFLAENFPTDMPTPASWYDMGGDDYRNATNSDFFIPGLPSLQPNLFDIGIVDFDGDVMFNSSTVNLAQPTAQQNASQSQSQKNVASTHIAHKQLPPISENHQILSETTPAFHPIQQHDINHTVVTTNVTNPQVTLVDHTQLVISKEVPSRLPSELNLQLARGQSSESYSGARGGNMENIRRQQQHEMFSERDAKISPNLAAATASNLKITTGQDNVNHTEQRNGLYNRNIIQNNISTKSILGTPYNTNIHPSAAQLQDINKLNNHQPNTMMLEQKSIANNQIQTSHLNHVPLTVHQNSIVTFHDPKVNNVTTSVMVTNMIPNLKIHNTIAGASHSIQNESNQSQLNHVPKEIRMEAGSIVDDAKGSSQTSPLVQLLRTNNKRQLPVEAFEPNKKLLLSANEISQASQMYNGIIQAPAPSLQILSSNDGRLIAYDEQHTTPTDEYQDVFKLPLTRPVNEGKYIPLNMQPTEPHQTKSLPLRSHIPELSNELLKQVQYSTGPMDRQVPKSERQTYLMQRQRNVKEDENILVKQEYLGRQLEQPKLSELELQNEINCRKLYQNGPRHGQTSQENLTVQNSLGLVSQLPQNVKTEVRDYSVASSSSRMTSPKYADTFHRNKSSSFRARPSRPRISNIPQPRASEIQQSQITLLRSVISGNSNNSNELKLHSKDLYNIKQNLQNNLMDDASSSSNHPKQSRGRTNNKEQQNKHKRDIHINAEQNRRTSLKTGFDGLRQIIPGLNDSGRWFEYCLSKKNLMR